MMKEPQDESILDPIFSIIHGETSSSAPISDLAKYVNTFFECWAGDFLHPLGDNLQRAGLLERSVFYCYLAAQSNVFKWLSISLMCGSYQLVMRELRTILEVMFPAYYLDTTSPNGDLAGKLQLLLQLEESRVGFGKRAFEMSGVNKWKYYYKLYQQLCAYTHLSLAVTGQNIRRIAEGGFREMEIPRFDVAEFQRCVEMWKEIAALALDLTLTLFQELGIEYTEQITFDPIAGPPA
jgi:hypothetical protein